MTCDQTQPLLDAFADGELGWGNSWRVRRHLAGCANCTAELAEIQCLGSRVHAWNDVSAPAGLEARLAATLPRVPSLVVRRPFPMRRAAVGLAGLAAASAVFVWLVPGQPGRPTIAFADVEQAMQQVKTVSWQIEEEGNGNSKMTFTNWLRRDPPAIATTDFQMMPSDNIGLIKNLIDGRGGFSLSKDRCEVNSALKVSAKQRVEKQIQGLTEFPQTQPASASSGQFQTTITNPREGLVSVNGQNEVRFDRDFKTVYKMSRGRSAYRKGHNIIWADLKTHRVVRIETHIIKDTTGIKPFQTLIQDHFRYNQASPKGVFDWSPPPGEVTAFQGRKTIYYAQPMPSNK